MSTLIVAYDFSNDKVRTKFSKFLTRFGRKLQYSVYEVKNSPRVLQNILSEIELVYKKQFEGADSIVIFPISEVDAQKTVRYGYAANEELDVLVFE